MTRKNSSRQRRPMPPTTLITEPTNAEDAPDEIRFPIDGHEAGEKAFIAIRRQGDKWAVIDNKAGRSLGPDFWDGKLWAPMIERYQHLAYRFTQDEAETLAKHYAAVASEVHQHYAAMVRPDFADWLAGKTEKLVAAVREQVAS